MCPVWAIYWTLGNFSKPLATIYFFKSPTFLGIFVKMFKSIDFSSEIIFRQLLYTFGDFFLVTLLVTSLLSLSLSLCLSLSVSLPIVQRLAQDEYKITLEHKQMRREGNNTLDRPKTLCRRHTPSSF